MSADDPLAPARGIATGLVVSLAAWAVIGVAVYWWVKW